MIMSWVIDTKSDSIHGLYDIFVIIITIGSDYYRIKVIRICYTCFYN